MEVPTFLGSTSFVIQSSDVLQDSRINVLDENGAKVIWYKERFLTDEEIIDHFVHNATSTVQWRIHRPKRGWYIRLTCPSFPPNVFISLTPVSTSSPSYVEAAMEFRSRTSAPPNSSLVPRPSRGESIDSSTSSVHSYPPTPPQGLSLVITPTAPSETTDVTDAPDEPEQQQRRRPRSIPLQAPTQITNFFLAPEFATPVSQEVGATFFSRALSMLKSQRPIHSSSFVLSRVSSAAPPPYAHSPPTSTTTLPTHVSPPSSSFGSPTNPNGPSFALHPVLRFHDQTPIYTLGSTTGRIEIDQAEARTLGVDVGFWVVVALAYLDFLSDRESYLAAASD